MKKSLTMGRENRCTKSRAKSQEPRAKSQEPRAKSQEPRAKSQEPRAKSQEPRAKSQEPIFTASSSGWQTFRFLSAASGEAVRPAHPRIGPFPVPRTIFVSRRPPKPPRLRRRRAGVRRADGIQRNRAGPNRRLDGHADRERRGHQPSRLLKRHCQPDVAVIFFLRMNLLMTAPTMRSPIFSSARPDHWCSVSMPT